MKKKNIATVIEITEAHVKFVQAKNVRQKRVISSCDVRSMTHYSDEEVAKSITEVCLSKNIPSDGLILAIARRLTILKRLRLPSIQDSELKKMIELQLANQIPYALEDIIYDFEVVEKEPSGYTQVLVVIVQKEICQKIIKAFDFLGLHPARITLSSLGVLGWLNYQETKKAADSKQPLAVINIDAMHCEICFCHNKKLLFSRHLPFGAKDLNSDNVLAFLNQIELSLGAYHKEKFGPDIQKILIVCLASDAEDLRSRIEGHLKIPTHIVSPLDNILTQKTINLAALKNQPGLSLALAMGLLLADGKELISLIPQEVHDIKKIKRHRKERIKFILFIGLALALAGSILGIELFQKTKQLNIVQEEVGKTKKNVEDAEKKIRLMNVVKNEFNNRVYIADLIDELYQITPPEISFTYLELDERGRFTIQGYGETSASVNNFQAQLVRSMNFKEVNLQFATKRRIFNLELTDFKITCQLTNRKQGL